MTATEIAAPKVESIFRPALLLMSGKTLAFAATFFIPMALARIFDPAQFGTYKQLFLVFSTAYIVLQFGMASSLYFFIPASPLQAGRYAANAALFLGAAGCIGALSIALGARRIGIWLSNADLAPLLPWIGVYLFLMLISATFEIVLIARNRYFAASAVYAASDLARALGLILPALLFHEVRWLLYGAVAIAALRAVCTGVYFARAFSGGLRFDRDVLREQVRYAVPFAGAILVEILQASLPQYAVSHMSDPATFAIFAVGCLQIPLVDVAAAPTSDVMMVRMQEYLSAGRRSAVIEIWRDTTWKLALLFLPLVAFCIVAAPNIIGLLFTAKYAASAPIFMVWSCVILLTTLQVDGVMRVFAETRFLLVINLMRLAIIASLLRPSVYGLGLIGPVIVVLIATVAFKAAGVLRMRSLMSATLRELLPWLRLAKLSFAAVAGALAAFAIRSQVQWHAIPLLAAMAGALIVTYTALVWSMDLLSADEKEAVASWLRARTSRAASELG